jgi:hypothetical protein
MGFHLGFWAHVKDFFKKYIEDAFFQLDFDNDE